jgi:hypothetical protein
MANQSKVQIKTHIYTASAHNFSSVSTPQVEAMKINFILSLEISGLTKSLHRK